MLSVSYSVPPNAFVELLGMYPFHVSCQISFDIKFPQADITAKRGDWPQTVNHCEMMLQLVFSRQFSTANITSKFSVGSFRFRSGNHVVSCAIMSVDL